MVLVVAKVWIEGYCTQHTVVMKKSWNRGDVHEAVAQRLGHKNFRLGFGFQQISVG